MATAERMKAPLSANFRKVLLTIELVMLLALSAVALVKTGQGHPGSVTPSWSWFNPFEISDFSAFASGIILMVFIYWGWDTGVAVNEETKDRNRTPGLAAILSTVACYIYCRITRPAFFMKQTLTRATPTLTPDK